MTILVENDANHSFLSHVVVTNLKILVLPQDFQVTINDKQHFKGLGICREVQLKLLEYEFTQDYYIF